MPPKAKKTANDKARKVREVRKELDVLNAKFKVFVAAGNVTNETNRVGGWTGANSSEMNERYNWFVTKQKSLENTLRQLAHSATPAPASRAPAQAPAPAPAPQATAPQATAPQATASQATAPRAPAPHATAPLALQDILQKIFKDQKKIIDNGDRIRPNSDESPKFIASFGVINSVYFTNQCPIVMTMTMFCMCCRNVRPPDCIECGNCDGCRGCDGCYALSHQDNYTTYTDVGLFQDEVSDWKITLTLDSIKFREIFIDFSQYIWQVTQCYQIRNNVTNESQYLNIYAKGFAGDLARIEAEIYREKAEKIADVIDPIRDFFNLRQKLMEERRQGIEADRKELILRAELRESEANEARTREKTREMRKNEAERKHSEERAFALENGTKVSQMSRRLKIPKDIAESNFSRKICHIFNLTLSDQLSLEQRLLFQKLGEKNFPKTFVRLRACSCVAQTESCGDCLCILHDIACTSLMCDEVRASMRDEVSQHQ